MSGKTADRAFDRALERPAKPTTENVPSLDEADRVVRFVLGTEAKDVAARYLGGETAQDALRELLAITIAVVGAAESLYRSLGHDHPDQWESLERSAETFTDEHVVKWLAKADPEMERSMLAQRRRKLAASSGSLQLVESERNKRARWARVALPGDAPIPIPEAVADTLADALYKAEERLYAHLGAVSSTDPLAIAGQVVGVLCAAECLLALFPSNDVAAFCVQLAAHGAQQTAH